MFVGELLCEDGGFLKRGVLAGGIFERNSCGTLEFALERFFK